MSTSAHGTDPVATRPSAGRRLAAAGALAAPLVAVVLVVASLLRDPGRMVLVVLLTAGAVMAAWTALVHRGAWRVVAGVVAVAALAVAVLVLLSGSVLRLFAVILLVMVSAAAARVALGQAALPSTARPVGPASRGVLFMNPRSGGGKVGRFALVDEARRRGITPVLLQPGEDLWELADAAVADGADVIGMAGGDGSQALVADVARRHDVPFVCVPAGTRNHFALDLGLDRENVAVALDAFGAAVERRVDLAEVAGRIFVNNASIGAYASIVQSDEYRDAKLATVVDQFPDLFGPGGRRVALSFDGADGTTAAPADVVLVSNDPYHLDGLAGFGRRARLDAGTLGVVTVTVDRARDVPALLALEATGRVSRFPGYREWTAREFSVRSGRPTIDVGVDGEALRLEPPLHFRSLPGALRVRTPVTASPAMVVTGRRGPADAATALLRVLSGRPDPTAPAATDGRSSPGGDVAALGGRDRERDPGSEPGRPS